MLQPHERALRKPLYPIYVSPPLGHPVPRSFMCGDRFYNHLVEPLGFNLRDTKAAAGRPYYHDMAHVDIIPILKILSALCWDHIISFTAQADGLYTEVEYIG